MFEIKSNSLKEKIYEILDKPAEEQLEEQDALKIESLNLDYFNDLNNDYDLKELIYFKNIENLSLSDFLLGKEEIEIINNLKNLKQLYLSTCDFEEENIYIELANIETLNIVDCERFNIKNIVNLNPEMLVIKQSDDNKLTLNINDFKNLDRTRELFLNNYNIKNINVLNKIAPNLEVLNIDGSICDFSDFDKKNINISHEETSL